LHYKYGGEGSVFVYIILRESSYVYNQKKSSIKSVHLLHEL